MDMFIIVFIFNIHIATHVLCNNEHNMLSRQKIYVRYYEDEHCWEEWTRSIDGAGAAKEDESTGAVIGAHRGMNVWRCRRRVGPPTRQVER